jgi:predicted transcriptional regulator of viral defense system
MWYLSQNFTLLLRVANDHSINQWLDNLQAKGVYSFSNRVLQEANPGYSDIATKRALNRLSTKGKIVSLYKGYYLIIPPPFASRGILPPTMFLDAFMKYLRRPYYVALLNAAAFHGASHQQPQEFFVMTDFPVLRPTRKKGLKINYISIRDFPLSLIEKRKTEVGYLNVSNAALTACDLVQFEKRIGGMNRAGAVLAELMDVIRPEHFTENIIKITPISVLQRLGYLLEDVCLNQDLADALFEAIRKNNTIFHKIPLKPSQETRGFSSSNRWKVIGNTSITIDE